MKRLVGIVLLALCAWMPAAMGAAPEDRDIVRGPACLDLSADNLGATRDPGTVVAGIVLEEPSPTTASADLSIAATGCAGATYTLTVKGSGSTASATIVGDGTTTSWDGVSVTVEDDDGTVCMSATSADATGRVADVLPNDGGCVTVSVGAPGGIGMR